MLQDEPLPPGDDGGEVPEGETEELDAKEELEKMAAGEDNQFIETQIQMATNQIGDGIKMYGSGFEYLLICLGIFLVGWLLFKALRSLGS